MIKITCSGCGGKLEAPEEYLGRTAKCKKCGQSIVIAVTAPARQSAQPARQAVAGSNGLRVAFPPEMENGVREELTPGEVLLSYCDMRMIAKKAGIAVAGDIEFVAAIAVLSALASPEERTNTVMLTNRSMGFLPKKVSFLGKRTLTGIGECKRVPLDMLNGVMAEKSRSRHVWHLSFKDPGFNMTLANVDGASDYALAFISELETVLSGKGSSLADEFGKLAMLATEGILSQEEFTKAKDVYLGKTPDKKEAAINNLRQLYNLMKSGVLTESEFRMKKWDILSRQ